MEDLIEDMARFIFQYLSPSRHDQAQLALCNKHWAKLTRPWLYATLTLGLVQHGTNKDSMFWWGGCNWLGRIDRFYWRGEYTSGLYPKNKDGYTELNSEHAKVFVSTRPYHFAVPHKWNCSTSFSLWQRTPDQLLKPGNRDELSVRCFPPGLNLDQPWHTLKDFVQQCATMPNGIQQAIAARTGIYTPASQTVIVIDHVAPLCDELWRVAELLRRSRE